MNVFLTTVFIFSIYVCAGYVVNNNGIGHKRLVPGIIVNLFKNFPLKSQNEFISRSVNKYHCISTNTDDIQIVPLKADYLTTVLKEKFENNLKICLVGLDLYLYNLRWSSKRVEVSLSLNNDTRNPLGPNDDVLSEFHRKFYTSLELDPDLNKLLQNIEVMTSSPGISSILNCDKSFVTFKGLEVEVTTSLPFKDKTIFTGFLVKRTDDEVIINVSKKLLKIPRLIVDRVKLLEEIDDWDWKEDLF